MAVVVDRQRRHALDRLHQRLGVLGLEQPGHVLQRDDVGAGLLDALGQVLVVVEGVDVGGGEVRGVADCDLRDLAGLAHGVDADLHAVDLVEAVEDPEDVHAVLGGEQAELADDVVLQGAEHVLAYSCSRDYP